MPTTSYWLAQPRMPVAEPPVAEEVATRPSVAERVDVAVVGGGVTGCSCALALAEGGLRVRLLEADEIAAGASGRNGGFALRGAAPSYDAARVALGVEEARLLWELSERALDRIEQLAADAFRRVGSVRLAVDPAERDAIAREYEALREDGFAAEWLDPLPGALEHRFAAGFVHPVDGALDPLRWVRRLAGHAEAAGATIVQGHRVDPFARETLTDDLQADVVVLAVDGMTAAFVPELADLVVPMRGQVLVTEPLAERIFDRPHYARGGYDYWQQLPDGRLLVGGRRDTSLETEQTDVDETTAIIQDQLEGLTSELLGRMPLVEGRWSGFWGESVDRLPVAGRLPGLRGIWVASGYSGHGNVLGYACGELIAHAILGNERPELAILDPRRLLAA